MSAMVDTMVLVYATRARSTSDSDEVKQMRADARTLLLNSDEIWISAITETEFRPYLRVDEEKQAKDLLSKLMVLAFDYPAATVASTLVARRRAKKKVCRSCLNVLNATPCKTCGAKVPRPARLNDIYIAATAEAHPEVKTLYTYDRGIEDLANEMTGVTIARPPPSSGPMFVGVTEQMGEVISIGSDSDETS